MFHSNNILKDKEKLVLRKKIKTKREAYAMTTYNKRFDSTVISSELSYNYDLVLLKMTKTKFIKR